MNKEEAVLADYIRAALIDPKTNAQTMQPRDALSIARHILAAGYAKAADTTAQAWAAGAIAGWNQSAEGWNAEYPDESTGECSVDVSANPYGATR